MKPDTTFRSPSRSRRRGFILALYGGYLLLLVAQLGLEGLPMLLQLGLSGLGLAATLVALPALFYRTPLWQMGHSPDAQLDERQVVQRDQANRLAYQAVCAVLLLFIFYAAIAVDKGLWLPRSYSEVSLLMWGALLFTLTLPPVVLGWQEPEL